MSLDQDWKTTFEAEIKHAQAARLSGNEGMARVCARRAAGALVGEYFKRRGVDTVSASAYDRLRDLCEAPGVTPQIIDTANLFLSRVTPEHNLPVQANLISEAVRLRQELLGE
jgi:hypothetical protein